MSSPRQDEPHSGWMARWGVPWLALLLGFFARTLRLGDANLWWDEALAVWAVRKGLLGATLWTAGDVHPPLYFWSLWAWIGLVGQSEFAMRALSVAFGVLTVAVVYCLGCLVGGRAVGKLAALLTSLSRFHVWWSQEMRMYVLGGLAGTLSLYLFIRWLRAERAPLQARHSRPGVLLALYILASVGALYTLYLMAAILLAENVALVIAIAGLRGCRRRALLGKWALAQLAILAALGVWLWVSAGRMHTWSISEPPSPRMVAHLYLALLATGVSVHIERYAWAVLFVLAVLGLGGGLLLRQWWRRRRVFAWQMWEAMTLALAVVLPGVAIYLATIPRGLFYSPEVEARYFLPFALAFWVLLSWSVGLIGARWRRAGWMCGTTLLAMWIGFLPGHYSDRYLRDELQTMVRAIASQAEPEDVVLLDSGSRYPVFLYYYDGLHDTMCRPPPVIKIPPGGGMLTRETVDDVLQPTADASGRIWLAEVDVHLTDPERLTEAWLSERYPKVLMLGYDHNGLHLYDPRGRPPRLTATGYVPDHPVDAPVGTGGRLRGWELPVRAYSPGDVAHVSLLWEALPQEAVEVTLRNERGQVLLRRRAEPSERVGPLRQQFDFPVYPSTPSGTYAIALSPAPSTGPVLGSLRVVRTAPLPRADAPQVAVGARLGPDILLTGYSLRTTAGRRLETVPPGGSFTLDLHWLAERKLDRDYTVFTHLLGEAHNPKTRGPVWGQHDSQPANDGYPTTQWLEGDVIVDRHTIVVDQGAPPGTYRIEVGMYTPEDGRRLAVVSEDGQELGDHLLLDIPLGVSGD